MTVRSDERDSLQGSALTDAMQRELERLRALSMRDRGVLDAILQHSPHGIIVCDRDGKIVLQNRSAERIWSGSASTDDVSGWGRYRAFHPDGTPFAPDDWSMARSLRHGEVIEAEEIHVERFDGTRAVLIGSSAPIFDRQGNIDGALSVFADVTPLKASEIAASALSERLAIAHRETEILLRLTERANRASAADDVFEPAFDAISELFAVERVAVLLNGPEGAMRFKAWRGVSEGFRAAIEGHSPWASGALDPQPVVCADAQQDASLSGYREAFVREGIRSAIFVPLVHGGELLGKFSLYAAERRVLTEREVALARAVATQVAQAVARGHLLDAEREARQRAERSAERTRRLERVTARLATALHVPEVAQLVIDEGVEALAASSAAIWMLGPTGERFELLRARGYDHDALELVRTVEANAGLPITDAVRSGAPIWLGSREVYRARYPSSEARTRHLNSHDSLAIASLPLTIDGVAVGALAFSFHDTRLFDHDERAFLVMLAQHCSQSMQRARLYEEAQAARARAEQAEERARFLARASAELGSSLDYQTTLAAVANLAVPTVSDWCAVDIADDNGELVRVAVAHVDPGKVELAHELQRRYPPAKDAPTGAPHVIRTGEPELYEDIPDELLVAGARDAEHLDIARSLGLRSAMIVPIRVQDRVFGVISFVSAESGRHHGRADLDMAVQLGERAGVAIAHAQLYRQAVQAVSVRDDFLSVAGHELRTPLTGLMLQVQSMLRLDPESAKDKLRVRAEKALRHADRLQRLIDELLDVSRISAGRLTLEREPVELAALVREVETRIHEERTRSGSALTMELAQPVYGHFDRTRIEQVVTNLFSNALKYGRGEPIEVRLTVRERMAELSVRDHGIGIPPEDQARIFARFERAVSSRHYGGLGLGLWIVRQIVEAHGGSIRVESEPGHGALFTVRLPLS